jgi:alpha-D-ribose 1-methylphosphonate 5-triphosphate diphosphatase
MLSRSLIRHVSVVTPEAVLADGAVLVEDGVIVAVGDGAAVADGFAGEAEIIEGAGGFLLPGLIDLHTDALEKEITPRPGADFPIEIAVQELDRKFVACGITTVFHSLHFGYQEAEWSNRSKYTRREVVAGLRGMAGHTLARTKLHARYEIVGHGPEAYGLVEGLLREGAIDLLSFMDHTPGQGQYSRELWFGRRMRDGKTREEAEAELTEKQNRPRVTAERLAELAALATALNVPLASHDDDTPAKVARMRELGVTVCEFPVALAAAEAARACGQVVLGGAANVLRGGSLTGNLDVTAGIRGGAVDGLCSDYYPPAMLHAVFKLWREGVWELPRAVAAVSAVPAAAAGIDDEVGAIVVGRRADLVLVHEREGRPSVTATWVDGERVHAAGRSRRRAAAAPGLAWAREVAQLS